MLNALLASIVAVAALPVAAAPPSSAVAAPPFAASRAAVADDRPVLTLSPPVAMPREQVTVTGSLPQAGERTVRLRARGDGRWHTVAHATTDATGAFSLTVRERPSWSRLRVVAPATGTGARLTTRTHRLRTVAQHASVAVKAGWAAGDELTALLAFAPARQRRPVVLQQKIDGHWTAIATGSQAADGTATLAGTPTADRFLVVVRAFAPAYRGARAVASRPVRLPALHLIGPIEHPICPLQGCPTTPQAGG